MNPESKYLYVGKEYLSFEELPPEAKKLYQKNNVNNLLDIYRASARIETKSSAKFEINGRSYNSLEELPLDLKEKILDKLALLERQGLRLVTDDIDWEKKSNNFSNNSYRKFSEAPVAEISPAFRFKLIFGLILLAATVFFIYVFISTFL